MLYCDPQVKVADKQDKTHSPKRDMNNVADVLAAVMDQRFGKIQGSDSSSEDEEEEEWFEENDFSD